MSSPALENAMRQIENLSATDRLEVVYMLFDSMPDDVDTSQLSDFAFAEYQHRRAAVTANPALKYPRKPPGEVSTP